MQRGNKVHLIICLITHRRPDSHLPRDIISIGCWCLEGAGKYSMGFSSGAKKASNSQFFKATPDSGLLAFFLMWTIFKVFLEFVATASVFCFVFFGPKVCGILAS